MTDTTQALIGALEFCKHEAEKMRVWGGQTWQYISPSARRIFDETERALAEVKAEQETTPFAWAIFDGEGVYDFVAHENNENYKADYIAKNGEKYAGWVVPLFEAVKALQVANDAFESIARLYNYEDSTGTLASKMYDARCIAIIARDEIKSLMGNLNG